MKSLRILILCCFGISVYAGVNVSKDYKLISQPNTIVIRGKQSLYLAKPTTSGPLDVVTEIDDIQNIIRSYIDEWYLDKKFDAHTDSIRAIAITQDGKKIISGSFDQTIKIWNVGDENILKLDSTINVDNPIIAMAITLDCSKAIVNCANGSIYICDLNSFKILKKLPISLDIVSLKITPDSKKLITGCGDNKLRVYDLDTYKLFLTVSGHIGRITSIAVTSDSQKVISGSEDKTIVISCLNIEKNKRIISAPDKIRVVIISPDDTQIIACCNQYSIFVWDLKSGSQMLNIILQNEIRSLAMAPDNKTLFLACTDATIKILDMNTLYFETLQGHNKSVKSIAITPDGKKMISGSSDASIIIWTNLAHKLKKSLSVTPNTHAPHWNASDQESTKTCAQCKKQDCSLRCRGCQKVFYCSPECQKAHWKTHKPNCK